MTEEEGDGQGGYTYSTTGNEISTNTDEAEPHNCKPWGRFFNENEEGVKRDINCIFKFKVGDHVMKRWNWQKNQIQFFRFYFGLDRKKQGVISKIYPETGEICIQITEVGHLHFGASELDFV
mgnify:CR=1 FL=1